MVGFLNKYNHYIFVMRIIVVGFLNKYNHYIFVSSNCLEDFLFRRCPAFNIDLEYIEREFV